MYPSSATVTVHRVVAGIEVSPQQHSSFIANTSDVDVCWHGLTVGLSGLHSLTMTAFGASDDEFAQPLLPVTSLNVSATCQRFLGLGAQLPLWKPVVVQVTATSGAVRSLFTVVMPVRCVASVQCSVGMTVLSVRAVDVRLAVLPAPDGDVRACASDDLSLLRLRGAEIGRCVRVAVCHGRQHPATL